MKKLLFLALIAGALMTTSANAQGPAVKQQAPPQPTAAEIATMIQEAKAKQVGPMVEKTGITTEQANRVVEVNYEVRVQAANALRGLNESERAAKLAEIKALKEKKYSEIPLSADQIKAVYAFYEDMAKNMSK